MDRVRRVTPGEQAVRVSRRPGGWVGPVRGEAVVRRARKLAVGCVAAGTFVAGIVLAWYLFRPGVLASVGTAQLFLLVGLFTLPFVALAAWEFERRARHAAPVARGHEDESLAADRVAHELNHDFAGEVAVGDEEVIAAGADDRRDGLAPDRVLVVEPRIDVARELLDLMPREAGNAAAHLPVQQEDLPRHRHPAHPRRRAAEGVG